MAQKYGPEKVKQAQEASGFGAPKAGFLSSRKGFSETSFFSSSRRASLETHAEVVAEILLTLAIERPTDDMALREASAASAETEAICAHRILLNLSDEAKTHLKKNGGLCAVVEDCAPMTRAIVEPGRERSTLTIFVLVDLSLAKFARSTFGDFVLSSSGLSSPPRDVLEILRKTKAWRGAVVRRSDAVDEAVRIEEIVLKEFLGRAESGDAERAASDLTERLLKTTENNKAYGRASIVFLLKTTVDALLHFSPSPQDSLLDAATSIPSLSRADREEFQAKKEVQLIEHVKKKPKEVVVDLTGDSDSEQKRPLQDSDFERAFFSDDEEEDDVEKKPTKRKRRVVFANFPEEEEREAMILSAADARGRGTHAWREEQHRVLSRRMDRAIWDAFRKSDFDPMVSLLDQGAKATYARLSKETALMAAAFAGRDDVCRKLLAMGADPAATDAHGNAAFSLAKTRGHTQLADLLRGLAEDKSKTSFLKIRHKNDDDDKASDEKNNESPKEQGESPTSRVSKRRRGDDAFPLRDASDDDASSQDAALWTEAPSKKDDILKQAALLNEEEKDDDNGIIVASGPPAEEKEKKNTHNNNNAPSAFSTTTLLLS